MSGKNESFFKKKNAPTFNIFGHCNPCPRENFQSLFAIEKEFSKDFKCIISNNVEL